MSNKEKTLLVGDNPFQGISHLSQERARARGDAITCADYAAKLVTTSVENGADGFMFSVSRLTLSVLRRIREMRGCNSFKLYALVPYAYEYFGLATQLGGIPGLGKKFAKEIVVSGNARAIVMGLKGVIRTDPVALMKAYVTYEVSRIRSSAGKQVSLDSVLLHEIITDMGLALDTDWLFRSYIDFMLQLGIKPGFETRNFVCLVDKFREWGIDFGEMIIATPFNKVGFQMSPTRVDCEKALAELPRSSIIAMSIMAAGYIKLLEAIDYIRTLPNLKGIVVGVSKEHHASETFGILDERLKS